MARQHDVAGAGEDSRGFGVEVDLERRGGSLRPETRGAEVAATRERRTARVDIAGEPVVQRRRRGAVVYADALRQGASPVADMDDAEIDRRGGEDVGYRRV